MTFYVILSSNTEKGCQRFIERWTCNARDRSRFQTGCFYQHTRWIASWRNWYDNCSLFRRHPSFFRVLNVLIQFYFSDNKRERSMFYHEFRGSH